MSWDRIFWVILSALTRINRIVIARIFWFSPFTAWIIRVITTRCIWICRIRLCRLIADVHPFGSIPQLQTVFNGIDPQIICTRIIRCQTGFGNGILIDDRLPASTMQAVKVDRRAPGISAVCTDCDAVIAAAILANLDLLGPVHHNNGIVLPVEVIRAEDLYQGCVQRTGS